MRALTLAAAAAAILVASFGHSAGQDFYTPDFDPTVALGGETRLIYPLTPVELLVTEAEANGQFGMVVIYSNRRNSGPGDGLVEYKLTETYYVLEGRYQFSVGDKLYEGGPGTVVVNPPKVEHGFKYVGDGTGRLLVVYTPSEADPGKGTGFFTQWASMSTRTPDWIARANAEYGIDRPPPK